MALASGQGLEQGIERAQPGSLHPVRVTAPGRGEGKRDASPIGVVAVTPREAVGDQPVAHAHGGAVRQAEMPASSPMPVPGNSRRVSSVATVDSGLAVAAADR